MAHYAFLDKNNIVIEVIVGRDENDLSDEVENWEDYYGKFRGLACKRTSYNGNIRKNYAGIGYTYDENLDAFIAPKPFESWILDQETCQWVSPIPYPTDNKIYLWDETSIGWVERVEEN
jgi:hypothetical protein